MTLQVPGLNEMRQALKVYELARQAYSRNPTAENRQYMEATRAQFEALRDAP